MVFSIARSSGSAGPDAAGSGDSDDFPSNPALMTHDIDKLIASSDLIVECTGDVIYGTETVEANSWRPGSPS